MSNANGHPTTLVAAQPGNVNALRTGLWSGAALAKDPAVRELAEAVMASPMTDTLDEVGAVEIAKLLVLIDRVDADLAERGIVRPRTGEPRALLDHRRRLSGQLERWLSAYGMTPAARAT